MKILHKNLYKTVLALFVFIASSCGVTDLDVEDSPNALRSDEAELDLFITAAEIGLADYFEAGSEFGQEPTRMMNMAGPLYFNAYVPNSYDNMWSLAYATTLEDIEAAIEAAEAQGFGFHAGISKIMKAYVLMTLVDNFAEVPYTEANQGTDNLNPNVDGGAMIYADMMSLLDEAVADIEVGSQIDPATELFFNNDPDSWTELAYTLRLRAALNMGDAPAFLAAIDSGTLTSDWEFRYGTSQVNPDARHPQYADNYDNGGSDYMSNYFMARILYGVDGTAFSDPRVRYYFYRQETTESTDVNEINCITRIKPTHYSAEDVYCQIGSGYWGRDHGDDDGIPPDNALRTIWGVYPVGGRYDNSDDTDVDNGDGALGGGISPLMLTFYVDFMRAEGALTLGTGEDARAFLESAINGSMDKVVGFGATIGYDTDVFGSAADATDIGDYVTAVLAEYDAATTDAERLEVVANEYYKALWGNGYETYNLYRRTGYPADLQPMLEATPGAFIRTHFYPANFVLRNSNVDQKEVTVRTFWDTLPQELN